MDQYVASRDDAEPAAVGLNAIALRLSRAVLAISSSLTGRTGGDEQSESRRCNTATKSGRRAHGWAPLRASWRSGTTARRSHLRRARLSPQHPRTWVRQHVLGWK